MLMKLKTLPERFHDGAEDVDAIEGRKADEKQIESIDQLLPCQNETEHHVP
jgi:hypothetical protein